MAYSELIKSFDRIRDYMRDFYVYGFKHRGEYDAKSLRSYDNERRRIESWLGDYMYFNQDAAGKSVFLTIDSRLLARNPLYKAFKAKSFTSNDIMLHFFLLDIFADGYAHSVAKIVEILESDYLFAFEKPPSLDDSTVRGKLREYTELGLLFSERHGNRLYYGLNCDEVPLENWADALSFFSETDPLGVVGSYLLDKLPNLPEHFGFKHHYILNALESDILYKLLLAIAERRNAEIDICNPRRGKPSTQRVTPLKIYVSTQSGRRYVMARSHRFRKISLYRLDTISAVRLYEPDENYGIYLGMAEKYKENLWGVSAGMDFSLDHIEFTVSIGEGESHIPHRLEREKRYGRIEAVDAHTYRFAADVYDSTELLPWVRTFIGRIVSFECTNQYTRDTFIGDLHEMERMYSGGDENAV